MIIDAHRMIQPKLFNFLLIRNFTLTPEKYQQFIKNTNIKKGVNNSGSYFSWLFYNLFFYRFNLTFNQQINCPNNNHKNIFNPFLKSNCFHNPRFLLNLGCQKIKYNLNSFFGLF